MLMLCYAMFVEPPKSRKFATRKTAPPLGGRHEPEALKSAAPEGEHGRVKLDS